MDWMPAGLLDLDNPGTHLLTLPAIGRGKLLTGVIVQTLVEQNNSSTRREAYLFSFQRSSARKQV